MFDYLVKKATEQFIRMPCEQAATQCPSVLFQGLLHRANQVTCQLNLTACPDISMTEGLKKWWAEKACTFAFNHCPTAHLLTSLAKSGAYYAAPYIAPYVAAAGVVGFALYAGSYISSKKP